MEEPLAVCPLLNAAQAFVGIRMDLASVVHTPWVTHYAGFLLAAMRGPCDKFGKISERAAKFRHDSQVDREQLMSSAA